MLFSRVSSLLALWLGATVVAIPSKPHARKNSQTLYLAGDSTMAKGNSVIEGWGQYLQYSLTLPVVNKAMGGRSTRSFTREGRFDEIIKLVQQNDVVLMEFGHNDGGALTPTDNGRSVCGGSGNETCSTTYDGASETVHTFPYYLMDASLKVIAKGGKVILSSQTPNNPWESGSFTYSTDSNRFITYTKSVATKLGKDNAMFINHGLFVASAYQTSGKVYVNKLFPQDHTHTNAQGADFVARAFVKGLVCAGGGFLDGYVKNASSSLTGSCGYNEYQKPGSDGR